MLKNKQLSNNNSINFSEQDQDESPLKKITKNAFFQAKHLSSFANNKQHQRQIQKQKKGQESLNLLNYKIIRKIGDGCSSVVYLAKDTNKNN